MVGLHWRAIALAGAENFFLINTALSVASFFPARLIRASRYAHALDPRRLSRVYAVALSLPPLISAWLVDRQ